MLHTHILLIHHRSYIILIIEGFVQ